MYDETEPRPNGPTAVHDTTVKKIDSQHSPRGEMGQLYLAGGKRMSMRLWEIEPGEDLPMHAREYETVGYVLDGEAELELEGQTLHLQAGDSWLVPPGAEHRYRIVTPFRAVEATSPPAHLHDRDAKPETPPL